MKNRFTERCIKALPIFFLFGYLFVWRYTGELPVVHYISREA